MRRFLLFVLLGQLIVASSVFAEDWPQWLGPQRDGIWREKGLLDKFPAGGPKVLWRTEPGIVAEGYAGPAVTQGLIFLTDRVRAEKGLQPKGGFDKGTFGGVERVQCFEQKTGKLIWTHTYDCPYQVSYAAGPRTTPIVSGDKVYTLGTMGDLLCLRIKDGTVVWSKNLPDEYKMSTPQWGFSGHPLIDGNRLICLVGGKGSVAVAFDKETGKELWKNLSANEPGYSAPVIYTFNGRRQLILWHAESVNGLDPESGQLIWTQPFGTTKVAGGKTQVKAGMSIATPRKIDDRLYLSCFYDGSLMMKLGPNNKPSVLWTRKERVVDPVPDATENLHCVMNTPVIRDGHIYGVCSYGELRCLELETGKRLWETHAPVAGESARWGNAFLIPFGETGDRYLIFNERGELIIARLTSQRYEEISRAKILEPTNTMAAWGGKARSVVWSYPAFADRCVFARNDKEMVCVTLAAD